MQASRKQRLRDTLADINRTNQAQLAAKAEARVREREQGAVAASEWSERLQELKAEEAAEERARKAHCKQVESFQCRQAEMKACRKARARIEELQDAAQVRLVMRAKCWVRRGTGVSGRAI